MTTRRYEARQDERGKWCIVSVLENTDGTRAERIRISHPVFALDERWAKQLAERWNRGIAQRG